RALPGCPARLIALLVYLKGRECQQCLITNSRSHQPQHLWPAGPHEAPKEQVGQACCQPGGLRRGGLWASVCACKLLCSRLSPAAVSVALGASRRAQVAPEPLAGQLGDFLQRTRL